MKVTTCESNIKINLKGWTGLIGRRLGISDGLL
jgi:hypothetical protein